jgi:hypothetical protein
VGSSALQPSTASEANIGLRQPARRFMAMAKL